MAIAYAGVYDGEAIRNALDYVSQGYKGATGDKTFDDKGDVGGEYMVWIVKGNEFVETGKWSPDLGLEMQD